VLFCISIVDFENEAKNFGNEAHLLRGSANLRDILLTSGACCIRSCLYWRFSECVALSCHNLEYASSV